jgi:hypothetical protein
MEHYWCNEEYCGSLELCFKYVSFAWNITDAMRSVAVAWNSVSSMFHLA